MFFLLEKNVCWLEDSHVPSKLQDAPVLHSPAAPSQQRWKQFLKLFASKELYSKGVRWWLMCSKGVLASLDIVHSRNIDSWNDFRYLLGRFQQRCSMKQISRAPTSLQPCLQAAELEVIMIQGRFPLSFWQHVLQKLVKISWTLLQHLEDLIYIYIL